MELLMKAKNPEFWKEVREKDCYKRIREELLALWEEYGADNPIPVLRYSEFKQFWVTGNRGIYETPYFRKRQGMNCSALLSLIYPEEEKYLNRLMDHIYTICDEYTWCVPAHQGQLDKNDNCRIDLFASETGFALSEIYTMLGERLEPLIRHRIETEVQRRIIDPFTAVENYGWWEVGKSNWTAVCMGSVACSVMLMRPELYESIRPRVQAAMENYLSGFKADGICEEGCGYWHYGYGFFVVYADMLRTFTDGAADYFKRDHVRTIAGFIQKMFLSGNASVGFADGGRSVRYHLGLVHYLKNEYPDYVSVYDPKYSYNYDGCARFCLHLRSLLWLDEEIYNHPADNENRDYYAPETQWFVRRTSAYGFAAKGGHNAEMHNHNDVGSFVFAKNGRQVLMDQGPGVYSRQYFSGERYKKVECSSRGHSVPLIGEETQFTGRDAAARDSRFENGIFTTDIAGAYKCPALTSLVRSFSFTEETVTLTDTYTLTEELPITERIVTLLKPELPEPGIAVVEDVTVRYNPDDCDAEIGEEKKDNGTVCYFLNFRLHSGVRTFTCEIR